MVKLTYTPESGLPLLRYLGEMPLGGVADMCGEMFCSG